MLANRSASVVLLVLSLFGCDGPPPNQIVDYDRDIRPILSEHCFGCHGPDEGGREADLRLDTYEAATALREGGRRAIVPGNPEESLVVSRIRHRVAAVRMPPAPRGALSEHQILLIERWIHEGARYDRHWAFRRPTRPEPPLSGHPVDAFIDAQLEVVGVDPSPPADPAVLLRRLYLDLTGLPPTPAEVDAFVADPSETAYLATVDRLLASSAFAEHMTRDWLDYVGYGDSNGTYLDLERQAWPYRDWVLDSFLTHRRFDDFIVAQLAGDLLPSATDDDVIATSFLRQHPTTEEGGVSDDEYRLRYAADRATLVGTQLLGITVHCARCHDHRYDPIPQSDFYRLTACFNRVRDYGESVNEAPLLTAMTPLQRQALSEWTAALATRREALRTHGLAADVAAFEATLSAGAATFRPLTFDRLDASRGATLSQSADGTVQAGGEVDLADVYTLGGPLTGTVRAIRIELGAGRVVAPILSEVTVYLESEEARRVVPMATAFVTDGSPATAVIDGSTTTSLPVPTPTVLTLVPTEALGPDTRLIVRVDQMDGTSSEFATMRVLVSGDTAATLSPALSAAFRRPLAARSAEEVEATERHAASQVGDAATRQAARDVAEAEAEVARLSVVPSVRVMRDDDPGRVTHILQRGNFEAPLEAVACGAPLALSIDDPPSVTNRLELARWIVGPTHPTATRVLANHYFRVIFGRELVVTDGTTDFGVRAGPPSHPGLLDWLAVELQESWDVVAFLRLLVTSAAYRRTSSARPDLDTVDADGRLFARAWPRRLDAEVIRDRALFVGGLLVDELGGPSVRPYHPEGIYEELGRGYGTMYVYRPDRSPHRVHRRAMYTFWRRVTLLPSIALLDGPSRTTAISRRAETNTPTQALALLNEPLFVEAARRLAERMAESGPDVTDQMRSGFRLALLRDPTDAELAILVQAYEEELAALDTGMDVLDVGESDRFSAGGTMAHRARTLVARILLNSSEFLTRE